MVPTWRTLSQYVRHNLLPVVPRKFQALHAAWFWGMKFLSRWRNISLSIEYYRKHQLDENNMTKNYIESVWIEQNKKIQ